jgi:glycosyltransferase involved in cell wall biosynthesis
VTVIPHEDDDAVAEPPPVLRVDGPVRICVAGAIGLHKGFHVLLDCALDASKRGLDLTFVVAGTTIDDQRLMDTGRVFVTGPYKPSEAVALIRAQRAALALLPSIWPETWCLGLTELWRAGLLVAAFDIGAPAERIRRTGRGFLLPLGLPASAINDTLSLLATGRSLLPIRGSSAYKAPG